MSNATVVKRVVRGLPHRDSVETWDFIVELLTQGKAGAKRDELLSVSGVANSTGAAAALVLGAVGPIVFLILGKTYSIPPEVAGASSFLLASGYPQCAALCSYPLRRSAR